MEATGQRVVERTDHLALSKNMLCMVGVLSRLSNLFLLVKGKVDAKLKNLLIVKLKN